jgi:penicillin-binding protein 1A
MTAPIKALFAPITTPIHNVWNKFYALFPRFGFVIKVGLKFATYLTALVLGIVFCAWLGVFGRSPRGQALTNIKTSAAAEVFSSDGVVLGRYYRVNRSKTTFADISKSTINALLATEDVRYFEHSGVDIRSLGRVFFKSLLGGDRSQGGGSTISMQLAKNIFPRKKYWFFSTLINKVQEVFIASRLEDAYNKEDLLTLYLNTVPFSRNVYGLEVAAQRFFGSTPQKLTVSQSALLIGMLQANTAYDPVKNPEKSKERRNTVLSQMAKYGFIKDTEAKKLEKEGIGLRYSNENISDGAAPYFREYLRLELDKILAGISKADGSRYDTYKDGLKIYTTIDSKMQQYAEESMNDHMKKVQKNFYNDWKHGKNKPWENDTLLDVEMPKTKRWKGYAEQGMNSIQIKAAFKIPVEMKIFDWESPNHEKETTMSPLDSLKLYLQQINAGFIAMDPASGAIKAWVGGINHNYFKYDHVYTAKRQVGSTFKPIVYSHALQAGVSPCDYFSNYVRVYHEYEDWAPENAEGGYGGSYTMSRALAKSLNVISAQLIMKTGIKETADLAKKMGITTKIPAVPAISLGTVDVSLFDMAKVYSCFANRGLRADPHYISKIVNEEGETIYEEKPTSLSKLERVLTEDEADMMVSMLEGVIDNGTATRLRNGFDIRGDIGGKTGTTQDQADAWFMCFTPKIVVGAWAGAEIPKVHFRSLDYGQGSSAALPIVGGFLHKVMFDPKYKDIAKATFPEPKAEVVEKLTCGGNYLVDSTYVDTSGVRRPVPGSGKRKKLEQERKKEEEKLLNEQIKDDLNDVWDDKSSQFGLAYIDDRKRKANS